MKIKGFMIIDPQGNSIVVNSKDKDFAELMKGADVYRRAKRHWTVNELVKEVREYMKNPEIEVSENGVV